MKMLIIWFVFCGLFAIGLTFIWSNTDKLEKQNKVLQHENDSLKTIIDTLKKPNIKIFLEQR